MKLTEQVAVLSKRVDGLESNDLDENAPIARITKIYGDIKITATIKTFFHQYNFASENLYVSDNLFL